MGAAEPFETSVRMLQLAQDLFPLNRSITGAGLRQTLSILGQSVPIRIHEVASGTKVFDWVVPDEWAIRAASVRTSSGVKIVDIEDSNLHVVGYSTPIDRRMSLAQLRPHLHSDPARPKHIPYRTSYYTRNWGFCLRHEDLTGLPEGEYDVLIDSELFPGSLTVGEVVIPGDRDDEIVFFTHSCHPSLANDNVAGIVVCTELARWLLSTRRKYTYRVVFGPGTIGSLSWLWLNKGKLDKIRFGLTVVLAGIRSDLIYKQSRMEKSELDRIASAVVQREFSGKVIPFSAWGYDERQFNSPGFAVPFGRLSRATEEGYPQYHSSADNLSLLDGDALSASLDACMRIVDLIEANGVYLNTEPYGEPQLGKRGLYSGSGGAPSQDIQKACLWLLSYGDGHYDIAEIYRLSGLPLSAVLLARTKLLDAGLLKEHASVR
jgi:aminopeptidase-like protein